MSNISVINNPYTNINVGGSEKEASAEQSKSIEVKTGSTIQGKVVSVSDTENGKMATISVGDGVINAKLSDGMGLREGQNLNFVVRGTGSNGVTISPLYENVSADQSTLKALNAAGLQINNDTIQMVKEMMEAGLSIDKSSLLEMDKNLNMYPNTGISTLVEMKSLGIPISESNIEQFNNYKNYEHQVINDMSEIIDELPKVFNKLSQNGNDSSAINLYGTVLKMLGETDTQSADSQILSVIGENGKSTEAGHAAIQANTDAEELIGKEAGKLGETENNAENLMKADAQFKFSDSFLDNLKNLNVSDKTIDLLSGKLQDQNGTDPTKLLFKELAASFDKADMSQHVELASWKKLFSSDEYNKLLKDNLESQWLLKPGDVDKKENIENLYQRLGTHAKALAEAVNNTLGQNSALGQAANNLSNNLDFMNQLNQMFQYVQLPLQMAGKNVHGDLYVYHNKHKKMSEDGSVSAVLHLDMDNLGPVDVYVKLLNSKVTTNFYVMDEDVIDLINDNIHLLYERLEKRGYTMEVNLKLHTDTDSDDPAIDDMLDVTKTPVISTASFDARA
ncbi:MAG: flagellar hook-length control protein FliK [Butyrivibrio sp.]|nr:flagellar hook-length control protein FliK [Butyrivibrio sp.]